MYPLFESIRIDSGTAPLLEYHQRRLEAAFMHHFQKKCPWQLKHLVPQSTSTSRMKWRFSYNATDYNSELLPYRTKSIRSLNCIEIGDFNYPLKWTDRTFIDQSYQDKGDADDVLFLQNGWLRDTSYCNIALFDGQNWFTPNPPLFKGVERQKQLEHNKLIAKQIHWREIPNFESFVLINSLRPFEEQRPQKITNQIKTDRLTL